MTRIVTALLVWLALTGTALAQGCGPQNPNCIVPTAPAGTNNNQAASTAFVNNATSGVFLPLVGEIMTGNIQFSGTGTPAVRGYIGPALLPTNQSIDIVAQTGSDSSTGYADNVAIIQNQTKDGGGACGNAALVFADNNTEFARAAFGYSHNSLKCGGYHQDTLYAEIGMCCALATDPDVSLKVINTHLNGSTHLSNTQFENMVVDGATGDVYFNQHLAAPDNVGTTLFRWKESAGGIAMGTYAAATTPPTNGLIASGLIGGGTSSPTQSLTGGGAISALGASTNLNSASAQMDYSGTEARISGFNTAGGLIGLYTSPTSGSATLAVRIDQNQNVASKNGLTVGSTTPAVSLGLNLTGTTFASLGSVTGTLAHINDGLAANCADGTCTTPFTNVTAGGGALHLLIWRGASGNWKLIGPN